MVFEDRVSKYPGRWTMTKSDGTSEIVTLVRNDEPIKEGTPINASTLNELSTVAGAINAKDEAVAAAQTAASERAKAEQAATNAANEVKADLKEYSDNAASSASAAKASESNAKASETESAKNLQGTKEYFEQVRTITIGAQGWYATPEALKAAVPVGENGWWAVVGTTDTIWTWDGDTGAWVDTRKEVDLSDYLTQDQIRKLLEQYMPLRPATASVLGGVKVGGGLSVAADGTLSANIVTSTAEPPADLSAYPDGTLWIVYKDAASDEAVDDTDIHMPADETGGTDTTDTAEPPVLVDADSVPEEG
nr:MAG TPA: baseplate protein [Caudoviricetes sp.]